MNLEKAFDTVDHDKCNLFLYADKTCLVSQHKDIHEIRKTTK